MPLLSGWSLAQDLGSQRNYLQRNTYVQRTSFSPSSVRSIAPCILINFRELLSVNTSEIFPWVIFLADVLRRYYLEKHACRPLAMNNNTVGYGQSKQPSAIWLIRT